MIMCLKGRSTGTSMFIKSKFHHHVPSFQRSAKPNKNTQITAGQCCIGNLLHLWCIARQAWVEPHITGTCLHQGGRESAQSGSYKLGYFCLEFCIYFPNPSTWLGRFLLSSIPSYRPDISPRYTVYDGIYAKKNIYCESWAKHWVGGHACKLQNRPRGNGVTDVEVKC